MKIVFMGSPDFAVPSLRNLVESKHHISAVVTQPDRPRGRGKKLIPTPVKQFAVSMGLPVLQPQKLHEIKDRLIEIKPEVIVVVAFGKILDEEIIAIPSHGCINVHASLLPKYRGAAPIHRAVMNGESVTGVTTMFMDTGLDTGDILLKDAVNIGAGDTAGDVHDCLAEKGARLLVKTLDLLEAGEIVRVPQNDEEASYAPPLTGSDEIINWNQPAKDIKNLVRGLNPWPGARTFWDGKVLKIWRVESAGAGNGTSSPGTVVDVNINEGIKVQVGDGYIIITELQLQGGKRMDAPQFLRGHSLNPGTILGNNAGKEGMK